MRKILSRNPFTGKVNKEFDFLTKQELEDKVRLGQQGFETNHKRRIQERGEIVGRMGEIFERNSKDLSEMITQEMGKPIVQSQAEVAKAISFCQHLSKNYNEILPVTVKTDAKVKTIIRYDPLGVIYHIVPFNFPFYLNFKGGIASLLLGNSLLVRNSDSTPMLGELTEKLVREAGFDSGQFQNVFTSHDQLDAVLSRQEVMGVCFTGSSKSGAIIAESAGRNLKKSVMELGGNDPFVLLEDAELKRAIEDAHQFRCLNAGQICFSPKRFIVHKKLYERFRDGIIEKFEAVRYGDPMDLETQMGPLARPDLHDNLSEQLKRLPRGWNIFWQKKGITKPFFPITVIEAQNQQEYFDEEMFGPTFTLFKAEDEKHAIELANKGTYGLGASVYSRKRGEEVVQEIRSGMAFVNSPTKSQVNFPSGGVGRSGYGRECGVEGMREFANARVYYVS